MPAKHRLFTVISLLLIGMMLIISACSSDDDKKEGEKASDLPRPGETNVATNAPTSEPTEEASDAPTDEASQEATQEVPEGTTVVETANYPFDGSFDPRTVNIDEFEGSDTEYGWLLFLNISVFQTTPGTPTYWQTWSQSTNVYLACGTPPSAFGNPEVPTEVLEAAQAQGVEDTAFYTYMPFTTQIDGRTFNAQPISTVPNDTLMHYEVRLNESTYNTVVTNKFYNRDNQVAFFNNTSAPPLQFNSDALEVKATWRLFEPGESTTGFYTTTGYFQDDNGQWQFYTAGLTGLHITSKVLPNWFWTSFEQVDNQTSTNAPLVDPIPPDVQAVNDYVHSQLPADSIWRNYNIRGTQWVFTEPMLLANTQIETYTQESASCITCHFTASIGSEQDGRLAFFEFVDGNLQGYVGDPTQGMQFQTDDSFVTYNGNFGFNDPNGKLTYKQLDFVWSLREAQPSCTTTEGEE